MSNVLIMDDEAGVRRLLRRTAEREGCQVADTGDPDEFAELLGSFQPDVVVLDLVMPEADGVELLRQMVQGGFAGRLILISGYDQSVLTAVGNLADAYGIAPVRTLSKPIDVDTFRAALNDA